jgi:hypothetical protein
MEFGHFCDRPLSEANAQCPMPMPNAQCPMPNRWWNTRLVPLDFTPHSIHTSVPTEFLLDDVRWLGPWRLSPE